MRPHLHLMQEAFRGVVRVHETGRYRGMWWDLNRDFSLLTGLLKRVSALTYLSDPHFGPFISRPFFYTLTTGKKKDAPEIQWGAGWAHSVMLPPFSTGPMVSRLVPVCGIREPVLFPSGTPGQHSIFQIIGFAPVGASMALYVSLMADCTFPGFKWYTDCFTMTVFAEGTFSSRKVTVYFRRMSGLFSIR